MLRINYTRYNDGSGRAVLDLQVSTVAELPALNEELGTRLKVGAGSIAQVIQTGAWYTLDDNGTWYDTSGTPASSESNNSLNASLSMSPTLKKAVDESDGDTIDLTEDDIDKISDELGLEPFPEPVEETKKAKATEGGEVE